MLGTFVEAATVPEDVVVEEVAVSSFFCPRLEKKFVLGAAEDAAAVLAGVLAPPAKRLEVGAVEGTGVLDGVLPKPLNRADFGAEVEGCDIAVCGCVEEVVGKLNAGLGA